MPKASAKQQALPTALNAEEADIASILRTHPHKHLLIENRSKARDIKNIDSDVQQSVCENCNKFLPATDTIRAMKSSVAWARTWTRF